MLERLAVDVMVSAAGSIPSVFNRPRATGL